MDKLTDKIQNVVLVFSDGKTATFSGRAVVAEGDTRTVTDITFTPPVDLPEGYMFDTLHIDKENEQ